MRDKKSLDSIQVLRGLAALAVVVHHACTAVAENGPSPGWLNSLGKLPELGAAGVDVFFVISGFIMVYVSRDAFGRAGAATRFWVKRLVRIVPLYWIYTTAMLLLIGSGVAMKNAAIDLPYTIASYLFLPAFVPRPDGPVQPVLAVGWSLSYEVFFYFIFGLWIWRGRFQTLIPFILGCFAAAWLLGRQLGPGSALGVFFLNSVMFEFLFGVIVGTAAVKGWHPGRAGSWVCIGLASAAFAATIFFLPEMRHRWWFWGVPSALLVHGAAGLGRAEGAVGRVLVGLGDASYTLYLQHAFFTLTLGGFLKRGLLVDRVPPDLLIVGTVAGCAVAAWYSYRWMEKPMNDWLAARLAGRPAPSPRAAALCTEPGSGA